MVVLHPSFEAWLAALVAKLRGGIVYDQGEDEPAPTDEYLGYEFPNEDERIVARVNAQFRS